MNASDVSIIIVNYRTKELVRECIKSITRHGARATCEIIVVDNSRDDGLAEIIGQRTDISYICLRRNLGFSAGCNAGMKVARGRYVLVMNPDITVLDGSIDALVEYMDANPGVGLAGPALLNPDGTLQQSYYRFYSLLTPMFRRLIVGRFSFARRHIDHILMRDATPLQIRAVDWILGACLFVRRAAIDTVGFMDDGYFLYFEDTDWCRRFWEKGWQVHYIPHVHMIHLFKRASAERSGLRALTQSVTWIHISSGIRYFLKHRDFYGRRPVT